MGRLYLIQLDGRIYSCRHCRSHLAQCDELVSKSFHSRHGKAYLFNTVVNVSVGPLEDRMMTTGKHTVADIFCNSCQQVVGWKYFEDFDSSPSSLIVLRLELEGHPRFWSTIHDLGDDTEVAYEKSQKYKEGKFILERAKMIDGDGGDQFPISDGDDE